jgi:hypothetical protein
VFIKLLSTITNLFRDLASSPNNVNSKLKYSFGFIVSRVTVLTQVSSVSSSSVLWLGKPWILPSFLLRTIVTVIVAVLVLWLEFFLGIAHQSILGVPLALWTGLLFLVIWFISILHLLLLRASNVYILRNSSLTIKRGIITTSSFVISPSGFGSMEVIRSLSGRIINMGDIIIRTQDPNDTDKHLVMLRDPEKAAGQIREVMSVPIFRTEKQA